MTAFSLVPELDLSGEASHRGNCVVRGWNRLELNHYWLFEAGPASERSAQNCAAAG